MKILKSLALCSIVLAHAVCASAAPPKVTHRDNGGKPGDTVTYFKPTDHKFDALKVGTTKLK
jgi:hypothetical protein